MKNISWLEFSPSAFALYLLWISPLLYKIYKGQLENILNRIKSDDAQKGMLSDHPSLIYSNENKKFLFYLASDWKARSEVFNSTILCFVQICVFAITLPAKHLLIIVFLFIALIVLLIQPILLKGDPGDFVSIGGWRTPHTEAKIFVTLLYIFLFLFRYITGFSLIFLQIDFDPL